MKLKVIILIKLKRSLNTILILQYYKKQISNFIWIIQYKNMERISQNCTRKIMELQFSLAQNIRLISVNPWFKSKLFHHIMFRRFESCSQHQLYIVSLWLSITDNPFVGGSNPPGTTKLESCRHTDVLKLQLGQLPNNVLV